MRRFIPFLTLPFFFLGFAHLTSERERTAGESVFADPAYNKVMPVADLGAVEYREGVTARLEYLESVLRERNVDGWPEELRAERLRNLDRLRAYRLAGRFPVNYDHPDRQLPCFLDRDGNLCAVAHLIAESAGMELVKDINARYQYATVSEMEMQEIDRWIASSGLTREEVITIQEPGFRSAERELPFREISANDLLMPAASDSARILPAVDSASIRRMPQVQDTLPDLSMRGNVEVRLTNGE